MATLDPNEAPDGHIAVALPYQYVTRADTCDSCSMCLNGRCMVRWPHGCSELDRKDRTRVIFNRKADHAKP